MLTPECKSQKGSCLSRGSVWSSSFNLTKATLGAGVLSLPLAARGTGIPLVLVLLIFCAIMTHLSIGMLGKACDIQKLYTYDELSSKLFGKFLSILVGIAMFVNCFGSAVVYVLVLGSISKAVFALDSTWSQVVVTCGLLTPLNCLPDINALRYFSFTGVLGVMLLTVATVYSAVIKATPFDTGMLIPNTQNPLAFVSAFSTITFAFTNQYNVPNLYGGLKNQTVSTMKKVSIRSVIMSFVVYATAGITGYMAFKTSLGKAESGEPKNTLIELFGEMAKWGSGGHWLVVIAVIGCAVSVSVAHPLLLFPVRQSMDVMIGEWLPSQKGNKWISAGFGACLSLMTLGVALLFPNVGSIIDLVGSFAGSMICYICPSVFLLMIAKENGEKIWSGKFGLHHFMWAFGTLIGIGGTAISIYTAVVESK